MTVLIKTETLQAIVGNTKKSAGKNASGVCHVDTALKVSEMVSRFLEEKDFNSYALDIKNY
ncbi:MAG: hypothetical protein GY874_00560 [Desulfobacteraceae bacterium]|nr:hypothetical protein [Desulfobacteraceae bacterium]